MNNHSIEWNEVFGPEFKPLRLNYYGADNEKKAQESNIEINYDLNSNGFRCGEFGSLDHNREKILYLGSSMTFGVGLNLSDVWCSRVSNALNHSQFINISRGAAGTDFLSRMLCKYINYTRPTRVIALFPTEYYVEVLLNAKHAVTYCDSWPREIHWWAERHKKLYESLQIIHSSESHNFNLFCRDIIIMKTTCDNYNIKFDWTFERTGKSANLLNEYLDQELLNCKMPFNLTSMDLDRSGVFAGPESHKRFAANVLDYLELNE